MSALTENSYFRFLVLTIAYILYLCLGAGVFLAFEQSVESNYVAKLQGLSDAFVRENPCVNFSDLYAFMEEVLAVGSKGIRLEEDGSSYRVWDFASAVFYSVTLITTIGYGHMTPLSEGAKAFSIVYSLVGIPFTFLFLGMMVSLCNRPSQRLLECLIRKQQDKFSNLGIHILHLTIIAAIVFTFFFLIPAAIFDALENTWNYLESLYFVFISISTIGLGDYVPGSDPHNSVYEDHRSLYHLCVTGYLLVGVGSLLLLCETVVKIPQIMGGIFASLVPQSSPEETDVEMDDAGSEKTDITNVPNTYSTFNSVNSDHPN
ncbi:potassium channel subfamily K member 1-like isoform X2 [Acanthaster planci]|uniref:Potassium channel subfamily K member 1-like isoform X2 n=1 Tax=Acanthaster planci TaxID=133434 RepID=A0A8B7Y234_ACAPL|nr:potassium channel subfamily K member 1-like isoform X2 [Acanthaster planci]